MRRHVEGCAVIRTKGLWTPRSIASETRARRFRQRLPAWAGSAAVIARGQRFEAVVSQVSSVLAPRTRLSMLLLDFADANAPPPGTFVRVTLDGPAFDNAYLLPPEAHRADDSVWVVDDGKLVREMPRTLGRTDIGWIVAAFDAREGVVLGAVPGERAGLAVKAVAEGGER